MQIISFLKKLLIEIRKFKRNTVPVKALTQFQKKDIYLNVLFTEY